MSAKMSAASKAAWADPAVRAKMSAARKAAHRGLSSAIIPKWVPPDLQGEFLDIAAESGEEAAASHCRRLKREMRISA